MRDRRLPSVRVLAPGDLSSKQKCRKMEHGPNRARLPGAVESRGVGPSGNSRLISLPLSHRASEVVGELDRTLVVVESQELLRGQNQAMESRVRKALQREHLWEFVVT